MFLFVVGSLKKGGAERNTAVLANHLVSRGHAVTIALFIRNIAFELDPRVNIVHVNHKRYKSKILSALYVVFRVRKLINKLRPKRLIAMSRIGSLLVTCALFRRTVTRFDIYPLVGYKKYKQWQFWFFYNLPWVKYVVCPSEELKEDVTRFFLNKDKLVTIYNPIPLPRKSEEATKDITSSRPYFTIVSRLSRQKNVAQVIEAYHRFRIFERADLIILGDGSEMLHLKTLVEKLQLTDCVKLKGFIGDPHPYMINAIALINASLREGFPNVVVEALSLGTPVISSLAKTGPKEIIFHGDNGYLFPVGDYEKLGIAMTEFLENKDLYMHMKKNVTKGLDRFTQEKVMNSWEKILMN
jgi:glycosyltransferase involved in cell wall biosynthesis